MNKTKLLIILLLVAIAVPTSIVGVGIAGASDGHDTIYGDQLSKYDITDTAQGMAYASETADRWQKNGYCTDCGKLKVYQLAEDDFLVVPASSKVRLERRKGADGAMELHPLIATAPRSESSKGIAKDGGEKSMYWNLEASECFARLSNSTAWMDHCYKLNQLENETDAQKDYFQLEHYATAKSKSIWTLKWASIDCVKTEGSSSMEWVDWDPGADQSVGNCQSTTIDVSAFGVGISSTRSICDMWDITKYAEAGKFKNKWVGSAWRSEREVAYMVCVKVPQGGWPQWYIDADYYATLQTSRWVTFSCRA